MGNKQAKTAPEVMKAMSTDDFQRLDPIQRIYVKKVERSNVERANSHIRLRRNKRITFAFLMGSVLGIYFYTMYAVRQERFDEEFDRRPDGVKPKTP